jgi:hypothetical protein
MVIKPMKKIVNRLKKDFKNVKQIHRKNKSIELSIGSVLNTKYAHLKAPSFSGIEAYKSWFRSNEISFSSQNGEDGILLEIFNQIGIKNHTFVEFGIGNGTQCNSANLINNFGWGGLLIEGSESMAKHAKKIYEGKPVRVTNAFITAENINDLIKDAQLPQEVDLLSVDIDGNDYWVWKAIEVIKPRVVVAEFNNSFGPKDSVTIPYNPTFYRYDHDSTGIYHGMSLAAAVKLGRAKEMIYVGCDSLGINAFFIRQDLLQGDFMEVSSEAFFEEQYFRSLKISKDEQQAILSKHKVITV